jgi:hypothetical protein
MTPPEPTPTGRHTFGRTLLHVLIVQAVALLLLWFLQTRYPAG